MSVAIPIAVPMEIRLIALFVLGACVGSLVNLGVYRLAWGPRAISPWSRPDKKAPPRRLLDYVPIFGWLGLRREAAIHGTGFWIRPMLVELCAGGGFAVLYWWEIVAKGLLPAGFPVRQFSALPVVLHCEYAAHLVLISLMLVASLIDFDEKTIPDAITVPGTLVGLLLATLCPWSLLPDATAKPTFVAFLSFTSPATAAADWPRWLAGSPSAASLSIALGCFLAWCAALLPRTWYSRHGWRRAMQLSLARLVRSRGSYGILVMALLGSAAIAGVLRYGRDDNWAGLLTALVGMAAGGGLVWLVRIIGALALRREAMGFGDVTLMAMIGAFLGWQTCLIVFFLAPLAGLLLGVVHWIVRRDAEIPFGPFLCLAALAAIVCWPAIWDRTMGVFFIPWLAPALLLGGLILMGLMLAVWRLIRNALG